MSAACVCEGTAKEKQANWVVIDRNCNYSAFNGGRRTHSAYSLIHCSACPGTWRTKARYVDSLPDAT